MLFSGGGDTVGRGIEVVDVGALGTWSRVVFVSLRLSLKYLFHSRGSLTWRGHLTKSQRLYLSILLLRSSWGCEGLLLLMKRKGVGTRGRRPSISILGLWWRSRRLVRGSGAV